MLTTTAKLEELISQIGGHTVLTEPSCLVALAECYVLVILAGAVWIYEGVAELLTSISNSKPSYRINS